jgi:hypothetical protein
MRKLSYKPLISGLIDGLNRGMASSNDVFDVELFTMPTDRFEGLRHDRDALRGDVQRAKTKLDIPGKIRAGSIAAS